VHYNQELAVLKEQHAEEVAQLKDDYEAQLRSLEEKYNQEGFMAAETEHEVRCVMLMCYDTVSLILNYYIPEFLL
jgi:hypothetical protein